MVIFGQWGSITLELLQLKFGTSLKRLHTPHTMDTFVIMCAHRHGQGHLPSLRKVEKLSREKLHLRSQFERPPRCFTAKKDRE